MRVFIFGGTGFLGYYSALEFLRQGWQVDTLALPVEADRDLKGIGAWFPEEIGVRWGNLFEMQQEELTELLSRERYDAMVYAVGPDDRVVPERPAYRFFHDRLVTACERVFAAARDAGIPKAVLLGSYFSTFDRKFPERKLSERHPYIRVRGEQAQVMIGTGGDRMAVCVLELPYIFGRMPGRTPLWKEVFLDRFERLPAIFFPRGGSAMIHVTGVAEAVFAAAVNGKAGERYPVGNVNLKYKAMLQMMMDACGSRKRVVTVPTFLGTIAGKLIDRRYLKQGREGGLDHARLMPDIQSRDYYLDPDPTREALGYEELGYSGGLSIREGIADTMRACCPERFHADGQLKAEFVIPDAKRQYRGPDV